MFIVRLEGVVGMVQALDEAEGCFLLLSCFSDDLMRRYYRGVLENRLAGCCCSFFDQLFLSPSISSDHTEDGWHRFTCYEARA